MNRALGVTKSQAMLAKQDLGRLVPLRVLFAKFLMGPFSVGAPRLLRSRLQNSRIFCEREDGPHPNERSGASPRTTGKVVWIN